MSFLFPIIYSAALTYLVWKAFKVMSNGWGAFDKKQKQPFKTNIRQKKYTIHPELLDKSGNITQEELLTVRFSNDTDSTLKKKELQLIKFNYLLFRKKKLELRTKIVSGVIRSLKLPPRFRLKMVKDDPVRLELSLTPSYGKNPVIVGLVESLDLVARRDREGRMPRDLQGTWDWTVRHGKVSTGGWNPMLKEALQTMFETGLPAIIYEELTGDEYKPVDGIRHVR